MKAPGVTGMDETRRIDSASLVEFGVGMMTRSGLAEPASLKEVLENWPLEFALTMLQLSMRPMASFDLLLGQAQAFVGLQNVVAWLSVLPPSPEPRLAGWCWRRSCARSDIA